GRHHPVAGAQHLAHDEPFARLAAGVEGDVAEPRQVRDRARREDEPGLPPRLHGAPAARVCLVPPALVSRGPCERRRARARTTTRAGATAASMRVATSSAATAASCDG